MTNSKDVQEFLKSRRARITPEMAGVQTYGGIRRVPGLRREELATISGMSVDYYNRLERGNLSGVSDSILGSLARALKLDDAERAYLFDLARAANASPPRQRRRVTEKVRPSIQHLLDGMTGVPAFVQNGRLDVLAMNDLARALYHSEDEGSEPVNFARFVFLDERSVTQLTAWDAMAQDTVAILRQEAARDPHNRDLSDLIGELSTKSEQFRRMWAAQNVRFHRTGTKTFRHPVVGEFELTFQAMQLPGDEGLTLFAYTAEPGSRAADALKLLATWSATVRADATADTAGTAGSSSQR
ncbi:helix-turn-helix domain-containing protein [Microbacterium sp. LMI12-1-1.1]|uniref:helix-turn-helix transcriptional regulator n=1 Tax=Microbacterium sp. LMI12-1-1.1 TaxID=3135225 RepID=UPI0034443C76